MTGPQKLSEFSFIGFNPKIVVMAKDGEVLIEETESGNAIKIATSDPLETVKEIVTKNSIKGEMRYTGGAVGYISYDAIRYWEKIPGICKDDLEMPDLQMGIYNDGVVFDHLNRRVFYFFHGEDRSKELTDISTRDFCPGDLAYRNPEANIARAQFENMVDEAKKYIISGDIFQVVLSKRYDFDVKGDLSRFYRSLRSLNPSPYMYFLKMNQYEIIGSSPEMLVRVNGDAIETYPIAGTRPITRDSTKNSDLAKDLLSDPKERAEHVMLVDLARNDLGRVSRSGSVQIPEFMEVHQYSHVQHIVSRVVGRLRQGSDCYDALRSVFPAGTVSGAPKIRAMEIIEEFEPVRRGAYAGAVGYFSANGNADFAITIRTLVSKGKRCHIQAGGGIVADSIPEKEWMETEHKTSALMKALELSEEKR